MAGVSHGGPRRRRPRGGGRHAPRRWETSADDVVPGRAGFYRHDLGPGRWLRVVVDFNQSPAFVVTAFAPMDRAVWSRRAVGIAWWERRAGCRGWGPPIVGRLRTGPWGPRRL